MRSLGQVLPLVQLGTLPLTRRAVKQVCSSRPNRLSASASPSPRLQAMRPLSAGRTQPPPEQQRVRVRVRFKVRARLDRRSRRACAAAEQARRPGARQRRRGAHVHQALRGKRGGHLVRVRGRDRAQLCQQRALGDACGAAAA